MSTTTIPNPATAPAAGRFGALAIEARGVVRTYGEQRALDDVDLEVRRGEVLALLGPNGAGKTTLVETLEGHRRAEAGHVRVLGFDPACRRREFRARIGIVLQEEGLDPAIAVGRRSRSTAPRTPTRARPASSSSSSASSTAGTPASRASPEDSGAVLISLSASPATPS